MLTLKPLVFILRPNEAASAFVISKNGLPPNPFADAKTRAIPKWVAILRKLPSFFVSRASSHSWKPGSLIAALTVAAIQLTNLRKPFIGRHFKPSLLYQQER